MLTDSTLLSINTISNISLGGREPELKDWSVGIVSGHRLRVLFYIVAGMVCLYIIQAYIWPKGAEPHTLLQNIWAWGEQFCITGLGRNNRF